MERTHAVMEGDSVVLALGDPEQIGVAESFGSRGKFVRVRWRDGTTSHYRVDALAVQC